jgi:hypothetical protein
MDYVMKGLVLFALQAASLGSLLGQNGVQFALDEFSQEQTTPRVAAPVPPDSASAPHCEILRTQEIKITCTYTPTPRSSPTGKDQPRIVLNRAVLSFGTVRDSFMLVDLTLTNEGANVIPGSYAVSLAVDDEAGHNLMRRILPKVDFSKLSPGVPVTFSERLLIGGFRAGHYTISLLISNSDPSLKDNPARNIILSNEGVADSTIGLNTIAHFTVGVSNHSPRN